MKLYVHSHEEPCGMHINIHYWIEEYKKMIERIGETYLCLLESIKGKNEWIETPLQQDTDFSR